MRAVSSSPCKSSCEHTFVSPGWMPGHAAAGSHRKHMLHCGWFLTRLQLQIRRSALLQSLTWCHFHPVCFSPFACFPCLGTPMWPSIIKTSISLFIMATFLSTFLNLWVPRAVLASLSAHSSISVVSWSALPLVIACVFLLPCPVIFFLGCWHCAFYMADCWRLAACIEMLLASVSEHRSAGAFGGLQTVLQCKVHLPPLASRGPSETPVQHSVCEGLLPLGLGAT